MQSICVQITTCNFHDVRWGRCIHGTQVEVRGQFCGARTLFPPLYGFWEIKLGHQDSASKHLNWLGHLTEKRNCYIAMVDCYGVLNHSLPIASQIRQSNVSFQSWINSWSQGYKYRTYQGWWLHFVWTDSSLKNLVKDLPMFCLTQHSQGQVAP